jgi:hypothetical protein
MQRRCACIHTLGCRMQPLFPRQLSAAESHDTGARGPRAPLGGCGLLGQRRPWVGSDAALTFAHGTCGGAGRAGREGTEMLLLQQSNQASLTRPRPPRR